MADIFKNPNIIQEKMVENCESMKQLVNISNSMIGADTVTAQTGELSGVPVMETFSTGFSSIDTNEIVNTAMTQAQQVVNDACALVAERTKMIGDLTGMLDSIKIAMASGDIEAIKKVQNDVNEKIKSVQDTTTPSQ